MSYCFAIRSQAIDPIHRYYHDVEYGFPIEDDNALFGRLVLELNQAGLSWTTILKKKDNFNAAYDNFNIAKVARYGTKDIERLLADAGIIRNILKVAAAIHNAQVIEGLQEMHGSFKNWLDSNHPRDKNSWIKLFQRTFKFTGGEITKEFLMSTGYLPGAHDVDCDIYQKVLEAKPKWKID